MVGAIHYSHPEKRRAYGALVWLSSYNLASALDFWIWNRNLKKNRVYPEQREASHPITGKILDRFDNICIFTIMENSKVIETFKDSLNDDQKLILSLLNIEEEKIYESASLSN